MLRRVIRFILRAAVFLGLAGGLWFLWLWFSTPTPASLQTSDPTMTHFMERFCQANPAGCRIVWTPLTDMTPSLPQAVVLAEDIRFYTHNGFDLQNLLTALKTDWQSGKIVWGGSTLTQQLAKNLYLDSEKTIGRKLKESVLTIKLERSLSKKRILEIYLNVAQWGERLFGIRNAAQAYFNKTPGELSPLEASYLASILPNPEHASDPAWKARFTEAGGHVFDALLSGYLDFFVEKKSVSDCQARVEANERRALDFAVAKTFNQFWNLFLNKRRDEPSFEAFLKILSPEEWAVVQGILKPEDKASGFDAFLALVAIRQHDYCRDH